MNSTQFSRRDLLKALSATAAAGSLAACATMGEKKSIGKVVVVGAGYGGATTAKYLRLWSEGTIDVTLVDPNEAFISCPISNLVLAGSKTMADITVSYTGLDKHGVKRVRDTVTAIDADKKQVRLASGGTLPYDRLVVSPGIEFMYDKLQGWSTAAEGTVLHAWKAGPQTVALRRQLTELKDGGVVVMAIPLAPYRCPPGPYERACQIAWYLKQAKPKSKLIVLDANPDYVSKKPLFSRVFGEDYKGIVDYRVGSPVTEIDVKSGTLVTEIGDKVRGDVVNFIPPQRAANIARDCRADHGEQPLVRGRLDNTRVDQGQGRARAGRFHAVGAGDAEVRPHGEPAWQSRGRGDRRTAQRPLRDATDDGQHLLQLHRRQERRARGQCAPLGPREENHGGRRGRGRHFIAGSRIVGAGRRLCQRLGADDLGGHAGVVAAHVRDRVAVARALAAS